jgi:ferric-dicitrate binding protein FerR (iron transport regulator)
VNGKDSDIFYHLITRSGFRDWVQKPNDESNYFWKKWMEEHPENISDLKKAREFIERMRFKKGQMFRNELDGLLGKIIASEKPVHQPVVQKRREGPFAIGQWLRIAAILFISLIAAAIMDAFVSDIKKKPASVVTEWRTVENPKGRKSKVTLLDGTLVNLNYESRLKFPKAFTEDIRKVELIGEAFFEVVPNETMCFIVRTGDVETEVLGTSFNIRSYEGEQETDISLVTGKVKVNHINGESIKKITHLSPGEQFRYNRNSGQTVKTTFDVETIIAWKDGIIVFEDAGFKEFIDQLEKWYGVNFQIYGNPSKKWKINGRYQNQKLEDILTGLNFVYGLEYKIQGKNVILNLK